jgi:hypothetical protein
VDPWLRCFAISGISAKINHSLSLIFTFKTGQVSGCSAFRFSGGKLALNNNPFTGAGNHDAGAGKFYIDINILK